MSSTLVKMVAALDENLLLLYAYYVQCNTVLCLQHMLSLVPDVQFPESGVDLEAVGKGSRSIISQTVVGQVEHLQHLVGLGNHIWCSMQQLYSYGA